MLDSLRTVYLLRDKDRKEMDADIKTLTDKITSHPERDMSIETLATDIYVSKYYLIRKFKKLYWYDAASVLYSKPHTEIAGIVGRRKDSR